MPSDKELIALFSTDRSQAIKLVLDEYADTLYGVCCRILPSDNDAQDALQDSFVKIWKNLDNYEVSKGTLFTWLLNICRNTCLDRLRSKNYQQGKKTMGLENAYTLSNQRKLTDTVDQLDVQDHVEKLDPELKLLIDKIYFEGYTHQELSELLAIPLGTVKSRLRRAMQILRKIYRQSLYVFSKAFILYNVLG